MLLRRFRPLAMLTLAALLSACGFQLTTDLGPSGSGTFTGEVEFSADDQAALADGGSTPQAFCEDFQARGLLPAAYPLTYEQRDDAIQCIVKVPFKNLDELRAAYAQLDGVTVNQLDLSDDRLTYDLTINVASADASAPIGQAGQLNWVLQPPGTVTVHNDNNDVNDALTWNIPLDQPTNVHAVATISLADRLGGLGGWIIGLVCVVTIAIAGVAGFVLLRRRRPSSA